MTNPSWEEDIGAGRPLTSNEEAATARESATSNFVIPLVAQRTDMQDPRQHRNFLERHLLSQGPDLRPVSFGVSDGFRAQEGHHYDTHRGQREGPLARAASDGSVATPREAGASFEIKSNFSEPCEPWSHSVPAIPFLSPTFSPEPARTPPAWRSSVSPEDSSPEGLDRQCDVDVQAESSDTNGGSLEVFAPEPASSERKQGHAFPDGRNLLSLIRRLFTDIGKKKHSPVVDASGEPSPSEVVFSENEAASSGNVAVDTCFYTGVSETSLHRCEGSCEGRGASRPGSGWQLHSIADSVGDSDDSCGRAHSLPERIIPLDPVTSERLHDPRLLPRQWRAGRFELQRFVLDVGGVSRLRVSDPRWQESGGEEGAECTDSENASAVVGGVEQESMEVTAAATQPDAQRLTQPLHVASSPIRATSRMQSGLSAEPSTRAGAEMSGRARVRSSQPSPGQECASSPTKLDASTDFAPKAQSSAQEPPSDELQEFISQPLAQYPAATYWLALPWPQMQMTSYALLPALVVPSGQSQTEDELPKPLALSPSSFVAQAQAGSLASSAQQTPAQNLSAEEGRQPLASILPQQTPQRQLVPPSCYATAACQQSPSLPTQVQSEHEPPRPPSYPWAPGFMCQGEKHRGEAFASQPAGSGDFVLPTTQPLPDSALTMPPSYPWEPVPICSGEQRQAQPLNSQLQGSGYFSLPATQIQQDAGESEPSSWTWDTGLNNEAEKPEAWAVQSQHEVPPEENSFALRSTPLQGESAPVMCAPRPWESAPLWPGDEEQGEPSTWPTQPPPVVDHPTFPQTQRQVSSAQSVPRRHRRNCKYARSAEEAQARSSAVLQERPQAQHFAHDQSEGWAPQHQCSKHSYAEGRVPQCRFPIHSCCRQRKCTSSSQPTQERSYDQAQKLPEKVAPCTPQMLKDRALYLPPPTQPRDVPPLAPPPPPPCPPISAQPEVRSPQTSLPFQPPAFTGTEMQLPIPTLSSPPPTPFLPYYHELYFPPQYSVLTPTPLQCLYQQTFQQTRCLDHDASRPPREGQQASLPSFSGFSGLFPACREPAAPPLPQSPPPSLPPPPASPPPGWMGVRPPLPASPPPTRPPRPPSSPLRRAGVRRPLPQSPSPSRPPSQVFSPPRWTGGRPPLPKSPPPRQPPLPPDSPPPSSPLRSPRRRGGSVGTPAVPASQRSRHSAWRPSRIRELLDQRRRGQQGAKSTSGASSSP